MEIEDLKELWKQQAERFEPRNANELAAMIRRNSTDIVARLTRSVWFELGLTLVAAVAFLIYALRLPTGSLKGISISILLAFCGYCIYYIKKLTILQKFRRRDDDLKANLTWLVKNLSSYLRFYRRSYTILYPVYFLLGLLFAALERDFDTFYSLITQPTTIIIVVSIAAIFYFVSTWFTDWYLKKLYGNHLTRLENLLRDLEHA
jgi:hypothetical protein